MLQAPPSDPAPIDTAATDTTALPVELALGGRHADAVRRWVEGTLGWQPVDAVTAGLVPAAVVLRDLAAPPAVPATDAPAVLVVDDDAPGGEVAAGVLGASPDAVVGWPSGRDRLVTVVQDVLARPRHRPPDLRTIRVGGAAGGVGTTTIAFALAGLAAWSGARTLVAVRGAGHGGRPMPAAALAGTDVWAQADEVAGVPGCRAVRLVDPDLVPPPSDPAIATAVVDLGVDADADVYVCRPDAAALEGLAGTTAAAIVVVGVGPVPLRELARAASGRRAVRVAWSARVARAALAGRLPAGLPGAWLRRLTPLVAGAGCAEVTPAGDPGG
jgi:hypothetical protein